MTGDSGVFTWLLEKYLLHTPHIRHSDTWLQTNGTLLVHIVPFVTVALYVLTLRFLPEIQKKHKFGLVEGEPTADGKPRYYLIPWVKRLFFSWNILLCGYSVITFTFAFLVVRRDVTEGGANVVDVICPADGRYVSHPYSFWMILFMISKFFELFDTVLLIVKNPWRTPMLLHRWHHMSVLFAGWYGIYFNDPIIFIGVLLNAFVHSIMYLYYALALYFPPPGALVITSIQIIQMICAAVSNFVELASRSERPCGDSLIYTLIFTSVYLSYLFLFGQFFYNRYVKRKVKRVESGESESENEEKEKLMSMKTPRKRGDVDESQESDD